MYCGKWHVLIGLFVLIVVLCIDYCVAFSLSVVGDDGVDNQCNREISLTGRRRMAGDQGFRILIVGRDTRYRPRHVYTVVINGTFTDQKFLGFMLVAVPANAVDETTAMGTFQEIDQTKTRFADECPHVVTHTDLRPKSNIEVLWIAPPPGVGCVEFRSSIILNDDIWLKDEGKASQRLWSQCTNVLFLFVVICGVAMFAG